MSKLFSKIRDLMRIYDLTNKSFAEELGISASTLSHKLNGHFPWSSDEMWQIMEMFNVPPNQFHEVFPRHGKGQAVPKLTRRSA